MTAAAASLFSQTIRSVSSPATRAYDLGIVELIDHGARVGAVPRKRLDDDHILRAFQGDHAIAEQIFHFGGNFTLAVVYIRIAVFLFNPRNFEQMQIFDISRNGRLRHDVIELIQLGAQLLRVSISFWEIISKIFACLAVLNILSSPSLV